MEITMTTTGRGRRRPEMAIVAAYLRELRHEGRHAPRMTQSRAPASEQPSRSKPATVRGQVRR
jgi:hypothetical protein